MDISVAPLLEVDGLEVAFDLPGGPRTVERRYVAPFARANREEDYRIAWAFFEAESA